MRKFVVAVVALTVMGIMSGCGYFSQYDNVEKSANLRVGMTKAQVREIMGEPLDVFFAKPDVWYYYVNTCWHDGQTTIDECMPVVFKKGKVAGWGNEYYNRVKLQEKQYVPPVIEGLK